MIRRLHGNAVLATALAGLLGAAGCGAAARTGADAPSSSAPPSAASAAPSASPTVTRAPVAAAGGVCRLLSWRLVEQTTGVQFDTAAAGRSACVLQVYGHPYPDLTLAASATEADAKSFHQAVTPDGADSVDGLGKAAYRAVSRATSRTGPSAEVGWLSGGRIYLLRYTFERGAAHGQAVQMASRLVALAKQIRRAR